MAVGLAPPNDFWRAVGTATVEMPPKEKIFFLSDVISFFGQNQRMQEMVTSLFPQLLNELSVYYEFSVLMSFDIHN